MDNHFKEMYDLLSQQKKIQQELLELSYEKRKAAHTNDVDKLNEIVQKEIMHLSALNSLDKKRVITLEKIAEVFKLPLNDITVSFLIEKSAGELKERLIQLQKELSGLLKAQIEINAVNKVLLETQLEYTDAMLNLIVGPEDPLNNFYSEEGKSTGNSIKKNTGLFDTKI